MARNPTPFRLSDLAACAAWSCLGAALVIHGCASPASTRERSARAPRDREPAHGLASASPAASTPAPPAPPATAPNGPSVEVPAAPAVPVFAERPSLPASEPDVRIRIAALRSREPVVKVTSPSGSMRMQGAGLAPRALRSPVEARQVAAGWRVTESAGTPGARAWDVGLAGPIEFVPASPGGSLRFGELECPGTVRAVPVTDAPGAIDVVADVPMEDYLPGVVAKELYRDWGIEAFRAQAIAARSFAVCEHAHWSTRRHYDVVAGEASQAWAGAVKDAKPREAAASTRGMVLAYEGRVVPAYYSSTCGGTPATAVESITRNPNHDIPPLARAEGGVPVAGQCCSAAKHYRWKQDFANADVCAQLRRWAAEQLAPPDAQRAHSIEAETGTDAPLADLSRLRRIASIDVSAVNAAGRPSRLRLVDQDGRAIDMRAEEFRRAIAFAPEGQPAPKERLRSSHLVRAVVQGDRIRFEGHGYGHGAGMCQHGAQALAISGRSAAQILATYYPGSTVVRAYGPGSQPVAPPAQASRHVHRNRRAPGRRRRAAA
jgi:stage II sporulation protein D